jgi:high-affinity iron transporter
MASDEAQVIAQPQHTLFKRVGIVVLVLVSAALVGALVWQGITASGNPDPTAGRLSPQAAIVDTGLLVFREGLEMILVLAAITASMRGGNQLYRRPIGVGAGFGFLATLITWFIVVGILSSLADSVPALNLQAVTGLLAIVVLIVIMNWFFHKVYWTGWISLHNRRKRALISEAEQAKNTSRATTAYSRLLWGLIILGFTSVYREGFEVVLFLQSLRLHVGSGIVLQGVLVGLFFTAIVATLTFFAHQRLPYKRMLVLTGVLLGGVFLVMVGEQMQEMQLAGWFSTTPVNLPIPDWMGLWFAVFPNIESLAAQAIAAVIVIGSYFLAQYLKVWRPRRLGQTPAQRPDAPPEPAKTLATSQMALSNPS